MQVRRRKCLVGDLDRNPTPGLCQGRDREERICTHNNEGMYCESASFYVLLTF